MYCISCGQKVTVPAHAGGATTARVDGGQLNGGYASAPQGPIVPTPAPMNLDDDDDATARPRLVMLTREEARMGCVKSVEVDRTTREAIEVQIPAGVYVNTKLDVMGYGNFDEMTGQRGPLRLSFFID